MYYQSEFIVVVTIVSIADQKIAILSNKIEDIRKFKTVQRLVNLNADKKRRWFEDLKDINEGKMIDSLPISMDYFKKQYI